MMNNVSAEHVRADIQVLRVGDALRLAFAAVVFTIAGQLIILIGGLLLAVILAHGVPSGSALDKVLYASLAPYAVAVLATMGMGARILTSLGDASHGQRVMAASTPYQDLRLVPVYNVTSRRFNGVHEDDLVEFIEQLSVRGKGWRAWQMRPFKSGRVCDYETWRSICDVLTSFHLLEGEGPRRAGRLRTTDADEIMRILGLAASQSDSERYTIDLPDRFGDSGG